MGYSLAITAYCQTCNRSHRAKDNEHRLISRILASNLANEKKPALCRFLFLYNENHAIVAWLKRGLPMSLEKKTPIV